MKLLLILLMLPVLALMVFACVFAAVCLCAHLPGRCTQADCIIVLGAKLRPDGSVNQTLKNRCDTAVDAWKRGVAEKIIACGGQMKGEPYPHSHAMRSYMLGCGVPEHALLVEDRSVNTVENLRNVKKIMESRGMQHAAVVTSDYHLTRAMWIVSAQKISAGGIGAPSPREFKFLLKTRFRETISWLLFFLYKINGKGGK